MLSNSFKSIRRFKSELKLPQVTPPHCAGEIIPVLWLSRSTGLAALQRYGCDPVIFFTLHPAVVLVTNELQRLNVCLKYLNKIKCKVNIDTLKYSDILFHIMILQHCNMALVHCILL